MEGHNAPLRVSPQSEEVLAVLKESQRVAREKQVDLRIYYGDFYSRKKKCNWPWISAFITSSGDVTPCCMLADSDIIKMGNIFEDDFSKIWNSKEYQDFRKRIKTHNLHDFCKKCYID
jgi:radical SAM protein with 4Fe4S-binding SPASM domain